MIEAKSKESSLIPLSAFNMITQAEILMEGESERTQDPGETDSRREPLTVFADKYELFSEILAEKKGQMRIYKLRYYLDDNQIKHLRMVKPD